MVLKAEPRNEQYHIVYICQVLNMSSSVASLFGGKSKLYSNSLSKILIFQAPAAFGLVSFLVHEGLELRRVKRHLLMFALAAPVLAIVTFLFLNQVSAFFCIAYGEVVNRNGKLNDPRRLIYIYIYIYKKDPFQSFSQGLYATLTKILLNPPFNLHLLSQGCTTCGHKCYFLQLY